MTCLLRAFERCVERQHTMGTGAPGAENSSYQRLTRALPDCAARRGLSRREQEVWLLLARRRTNREISLQLNISLRTVEHHVGRVIAKFGVTNRREAGVVCLSHAAASDRFTNGCGGDWC